MRVGLFFTLLAAGGCIPHLEGNSAEKCGAWVAPENSWTDPSLTGPPDGLCGEGYSKGQVAPDVRLTAQNGEEVSLWQFYGDVVLLDVCTIWCDPCQKLGETADATYQARKDDGFLYFTVIQEDFDGNPPDDADLNSWGDSYGISTPIVADTTDPRVTATAIVNGFLPGVLVLDREMKVVARVNPPNTEEVDAAIDAAL
jgi:hypothetical protein